MRDGARPHSRRFAEIEAYPHTGAFGRSLSHTLGAALSAACVARSGGCTRSAVAAVDLAAGPAAWRAALRKSSRSLINWGRRNLAIRYVNRDISERALFEQYREFHVAVAGRSTRPKASWDVIRRRPRRADRGVARR
jgi:hypothetical protein